MPKLMKRRMADEVRKLLEGVDDVLVVGLEPMDTERNLELRNRIRGEGGRLRVVHNRTARFGLEKRLEGLGPWLRGQTALALGREAIPLARALVEAAQLNLVRVRGGLVEGELLDAAGVRALAAIPDRPTLRAMALSAVLGPARGLAVAVQAVGGGLARCLQARVDRAGGSGAEAGPNEETGGA